MERLLGHRSQAEEEVTCQKHPCLSMKNLITLLSFMLIPMLVFAQEDNHLWDDYMEETSELGDEENVQREIDIEELTTLFTNKIDLNTATREDLEQLPFLSAEQIEELCEYIYRYAPLKSLAELYMIESLDYRTRQLLEHFVYVGQRESRHFPTLDKITKYGKHQLLATASIPFYERKGDKQGYYGYPYKHSLRYQFAYGQYVKAGLVASQDAGEPFLSAHNRYGYDYYSFYVVLKKLGRLKTLAVGRYRMKLGMGLILNSDMSLGKTMTLASLGRNTNVIRGHSSRMEANYMQGAAATVALSHHIDATAFVSYRNIDATLTGDSSAIRTILTTGYHRTESELARKNNAKELMTGASIAYYTERIRIGLQGVYNSFDIPLNPNNGQLYCRHYPEGKSFWNASMSYAYRGRIFGIQGETALCDNNALATINTLSLCFGNELSLLALQRFYSYKYTALHAMSFSEGGHVNNESGVYIGANWQPSRNFSLTAYTDFAYFPWARYRTSDASHTTDNMLSATYTHGKLTFAGRYRVKTRQLDNSDKSALDTRTDHRWRLSCTWSSGKLSAKTQADATLSRLNENSFGYMISENIGYKHDRWSVIATANYFHTDNYDSRIYAYERGMMYQMSFPMYYGHGIRYALWAQADITSSLQLTAKIGTTDYFDRSAIGSSLQQIDHSSKTDLDIQLRWKF